MFIALEAALRSIVKTPGVSLLVLLAIALGVGITMPMVVLYHNSAKNPIPDKSDQLYIVQIDNWLLDSPFWFNAPDMPPDIMTARDARAIMQSDIPSHTGVAYSTLVSIRSADQNSSVKPFFTEIRVTTRDFFPMFDVPVAHGQVWDKATGESGENVAVLSYFTNQRLFGGGNNVGKEFKIGGELYRVIGILDSWSFTPRLYALTGTNDRTEGVFVPLSNFQRSHLKPTRAATVDGDVPQVFDQAYLNSETVFAFVWVELKSEEKLAAFTDFVTNYVAEQRALGRIQRSPRVEIYSGTEWLNVAPVAQGSKSLYTVFIVVAVFFLVVCLFNLLSLLLGKFMTAIPEAAVLRALGATRMHIFMQYLLEVMLLGLAGGILSIYIARTALRAMVFVYVNNLPPEFKEVQGTNVESSPYIQFDAGLLLMTFALALIASLVAAAIPAWRACRIPPAEYLKLN